MTIYSAEKYREMGFTILSDGRVKDKNGNIFCPRKSTSAAKACRWMCLECMGLDRRNEKAPRSYEDVDNCRDPLCPIFDFRYGKSPFYSWKASLGTCTAPEATARQ